MMKKIGSKNCYAVVSSVGATVHEFVFRKWNVVSPSRLVGKKQRGGIPICFPFFGSPPEGWDLSKHGFLRTQELNLLEESDMHVVFEGRNESTDSYPWKLSYQITVTILPSLGLELKLLTTRLADGKYFDAPINPAFHPYFPCDFDDLVAPQRVRIGNKVYTDFCIESKRVSMADDIYVRASQQSVWMKLGGDYNKSSVLTLWTDSKEYFCLEPVFADPSEFFTPEGRFLKEGEQFEIMMRLIVK